MPPAFAAMLRDECNRREISQRHLAQVGGCAQTFVSKVMRDLRRASIAHAEAWADDFRLNQAARRRFLLLAALAHVPDERLRTELESLID